MDGAGHSQSNYVHNISAVAQCFRAKNSVNGLKVIQAKLPSAGSLKVLAAIPHNYNLSSKDPTISITFKGKTAVFKELSNKNKDDAEVNE